jgi:anti-sigma B factor antagonist
MSMFSNFAVQTHSTGRAITLALTGELDLVSSPAMERVMDDLSRSDAELIIVDLSGLEFMDSTGLHLLIRVQQRAQEAGRRFALIRGREAGQRLFELTGLADSLTVVDSAEQLLEADQAPGAS